MGQNGVLVPNTLHPRADDSSYFSDSPAELKSHPESDSKLDRASLAEALEQLHRLLEEYAPSWYTRKHHATAEAALRSLKGP